MLNKLNDPGVTPKIPNITNESYLPGLLEAFAARENETRTFPVEQGPGNLQEIPN
jgi:hypothetical protein